MQLLLSWDKHVYNTKYEVVCDTFSSDKAETSYGDPPSFGKTIRYCHPQRVIRFAGRKANVNRVEFSATSLIPFLQFKIALPDTRQPE